jgi:hypothetical protein
MVVKVTAGTCLLHGHPRFTPDPIGLDHVVRVG